MARRAVFECFSNEKTILVTGASGGRCGTLKQQPPGQRAEQFLNAFPMKKLLW